jgi:hypothetical protein
MIRSSSKRKYMSLKREKQAVSDGQEDAVMVLWHICTWKCIKHDSENALAKRFIILKRKSFISDI